MTIETRPFLGIVPMPEGQRSVTTGPAPGLPGTNLIALDQRASSLTAIGVNVYPWGHRRQAYSFLEVRWLLPSSAARSLRSRCRRRLDDHPQIRSDGAVLRVPGSRLEATVADLAARVMRAVRDACRPSGVASGFIALATRRPIVAASRKPRMRSTARSEQT
jgi:hypothetical protein